MDPFILLGAVLVGSAVVAGIFFRKRQQLPKSISTVAEPLRKTEPASEPQQAAAPDALFGGLTKTRSLFSERIGRFLKKQSQESLESTEWEALEEALLEGDIGAATTQHLIEAVKTSWDSHSGSSMKSLLQNEMEKILSVQEQPLEKLFEEHKPLVISVVGINGAGKTTTIGKLANRFKKEGKTVLLGAGDTFRAGAIAQLRTWAERVGVEFVTGREGADPGAVAFDSVAAGKARGVDVVILDTAGRLHTKTSLMDELKKIQRVVKKVIPDAPHEIWLVLDGTLGQNSLQQAREFQKALGVSGLIVTKLDGTAKGGALLPVAQELSLPVRFIGVGEGQEDLLPFNAKRFVEAVFSQ